MLTDFQARQYLSRRLKRLIVVSSEDGHKARYIVCLVHRNRLVGICQS